MLYYLVLKGTVYMNFKRKISLMLVGAVVIAAFASCSATDTANSVTASAGMDKYVDFLEENLDEMPDSLVIAVGDGTDAYGVDMTGYIDDCGYTIRADSGSVVMLGKTEGGIDRAVRHFVNYGNEQDYFYTYGEGYRVKRLTVMDNDISEYAIVLPDDPDECMLYAADELTKYIALACGVNIPVYTETEYSSGGTKPIRTILFAEDYPGNGNEGFTINVKDDGNIELLCGRYRGALYGVYDLLGDIGWRFLADNVEYLYESECVNLTEAINRTENAAIPNRFVWDSLLNNYGNSAFPKLKYQLRQYFSAEDRAKYGMYGLIPEACHGLQSGIDFGDAYPGIEVAGMQPCYTNEDFLQVTEDYFRGYIESCLESGYTPGKELCYIDVSQFDNETFCQCADCMDVLAEEGSVCGPVLRMTNRMADMAAEYSSEISVLMLAYAGTNKAPKTTKPRDNVKISYCFFVGSGRIACSNHSITGEDCVDGRYTNTVYGKEFKEWIDFCGADKMQVWYYPFNSYEVALQTPCLDTAYEDMKFLLSSGISCIMFNSGDNNDPILVSVLSELIWNGDMTEEEYDALVKEYYYIIYGESAELIYEYTKIFIEAGDRAGCWCAFHSRAKDKVDAVYLAENFDYMTVLFDKALSLAENEDVYNRIEILKARMLYICITLTHGERYLNGTAEDRKVMTDRYTECHRLFRKHNILVFDNYIIKAYAAEELDLERTPSEHWCIY